MSLETLSFPEAFKDVTGGNHKVKTNEYLTEGTFPIIDQGKELIAGYVDNEEMLCKATKPSIIFGDHTKIIKFVDFDFVLGADGVKVLQPCEKLYPKYAYHYLKTIKFPEKTGYMRHFKYLKRAIIPIPPLNEQKRIAAILDKADDIRMYSDYCIPLRKQLIHSLFLEMFGDPILNPKSIECVSLIDATLGDKKGMIRGPFGGSLKKSMFVEQGYKVYQQGNAIRNDLTYGDYFITKEKYLEMSRFAVAENDLIISCSGTKGKIAIIPPEFEPGIINQALMMIKTNRQFSPIFLKFQLELEQLNRILFGGERGSGISNVAPMSEFRKQQILAPPLFQQLEFENRIQQINTIFDSIHHAAEQKRELALSSIQSLIAEEMLT
ncbi:MAG TPA: restriction endonuclease subunit S [Candidatus Poseidoniales archaeon]|nr:MAG TPA: restriction endonuclease subunit S [Candidatus Poseidoniales archaeon]HII62215.1 hypothetical protein [Candidatus Poseidoniaceae archaeon]|tara:strand:- start:979 stop:2118 length:1140 start_codon:yes stop_codon:yes gene_type:complete